MPRRLDPPLTPRRGTPLNVLGVCRISGANQDPKSLADQEALLRRYVAEHFDGPVRWTVLATTGSGEWLDRDELRQIEDHIAAKTFDLIVTEDLGRICRRTRAMLICEDALSSETRLLALNDNVDTATDHWRTSAMFATLRHETFNKDTSSRICRTVQNRFMTEGLITSVPYGYLKPFGCKSDVCVSKDPRAERVYEEWFRRLEQGASYSEIMDFLNSERIPPGPSAKSKRWSVSLVRGTTMNPMLKGVREHNVMKSQRNNATGRHRSVKAPLSERLVRLTPHLAFIDPERYDRVVGMLRVRNLNRGRKRIDGQDPRFGVPRKQSPWPGQHITCGICGRILYYGGDGRPDKLKCSGAQKYRCWSGSACSGPRVAERVSAALFAEIAALPEFDEQFLDQMREKARTIRAKNDESLADLEQQQRKLAKQISTTVDLLAEGGFGAALKDKLRELESERDQNVAMLGALRNASREDVKIPSVAHIKSMILEAFANLARDSPEFGRLMRILIPKLEVRPVRLCSQGEPKLRVHFTLEVAALNPELRGLAELGGLLRKEVVVDLFDAPQRVVYREEVMRLRAEGLTKYEIAAQTGITHTAVQAAVTLDACMKLANSLDPYVEITEPIDDLSRLCRYQHPRYKFEPLATMEHKKGIAPGMSAV